MKNFYQIVLLLMMGQGTFIYASRVTVTNSKLESEHNAKNRCQEWKESPFSEKCLLSENREMNSLAQAEKDLTKKRISSEGRLSNTKKEKWAKVFKLQEGEKVEEILCEKIEETEGQFVVKIQDSSYRFITITLNNPDETSKGTGRRPLAEYLKEKIDL